MAKRIPLVFEGGEIIESKSTDTMDLNNGVVKATGGTAERNLKDILADTLSVKDFGAKGDGTTDDTAAFQAAAAHGGVIYVPHGTYKLTESVQGDFISFGHPTFTGAGATVMDKNCTDLYNDYVHKNAEYLPSGTYEQIYGDKQALGKWNFKGQTIFDGAETHNAAETHKGAETHEGNETHGKASGTTLTFHGTEVHDGNETHGQASGTTLTYHGTEVHDGPETHTGAENHSGTETHSGGETHTGNEAHNGNVTIGTAGSSKTLVINTSTEFKGPVDFSGMTDQQKADLLNDLIAGGTGDGFEIASGKLKVKTSELIPGTATDGLAIDSNGKIKVAPSELAGLGLSGDDSTGKLSAKLKSNGGLSVDANGIYLTNPIPTASDLVDGSSTTDGLTTANGKIKVKPTELAGTGLTGNDSTGKLSVNVNDLIPGNTTDGFEVVSGKLKVNPEEFAGAGLVEKDGKLTVDFSGTDDAVKEALDNLMASLHLPKWLTGSNGKAHFYVDASKPSSNNVDDGVYGRSAANAWNSINYATTTIAKNYNIHSLKVYIHIAPGTYNEAITLADQTRTTGFVLLAPSTQNGVVNITRTAASGHMIDHTAGSWKLEQLNFKYNLSANTGSSSSTPAFIYTSSADTTLGIRRCNFEFAEVTSGDNAISNSTKAINLRAMYCSGGRLSFNNMTLEDDAFEYSSSNKANPVSTFKGTKSDSHLNVAWFYVQNGGLLSFGKSDSADNESKFTGNTPTINVTGAFNVFLKALTQGIVRSAGTGDHEIAFTGSPSGKKYDVDSGAIVTGFASKLPGSEDGTPTAATIPGYIS